MTCIKNVIPGSLCSVCERGWDWSHRILVSFFCPLAARIKKGDIDAEKIAVPSPCLLLLFLSFSNANLINAKSSKSNLGIYMYPYPQAWSGMVIEYKIKGDEAIQIGRRDCFVYSIYVYTHTSADRNPEFVHSASSKWWQRRQRRTRPLLPHPAVLLSPRSVRSKKENSITSSGNIEEEALGSVGSA